MTTRIRILPENLANRIAAGEVVERPASVVKELVENCLDAGARSVTVEMESGGKRLIRVTDDGCGMTQEDALLALERHATSKIASDADLFNLATLGFRGEALPSIASVSRFTLATRPKESIEGTEIYAEGGKIRDVRSCGMAPGTSISVASLFFNTPGRLKFLKSVETEEGHVGELMLRLALSRPDVGFTFIKGGKTVFRASAADAAARGALLLGSATWKHLFPVEYRTQEMTVRGFIASPDATRSSASHLYTYVNGRFVRDRLVQHAVMAAYRGIIERGRYPVALLFVAVPPDEVDVNVHPTKHEVRFRRQGEVHDVIVAALFSVLSRSPWLVQASPRPPSAPMTIPAAPPAAARRVQEVRESMERYLFRNAPVAAPVEPIVSSVGQPASLSVPEPPEAAPAEGYFSSLTVIGQFRGSYIVCEEGSELVLVDQHAAHERVAFERLKAQFASEGVESQRLLFPQTVHLSPAESAAVAAHTDFVARLGFEVDDFGGGTWAVKAVPRILADADVVSLLRDISAELAAHGRSAAAGEVLEEILADLACRSVIRGRHPLTTPEIRALFASMDHVDCVSTCPHGRPVSRRLTLSEIERMFGRQ